MTCKRAIADSSLGCLISTATGLVCSSRHGFTSMVHISNPTGTIASPRQKCHSCTSGHISWPAESTVCRSSSRTDRWRCFFPSIQHGTFQHYERSTVREYLGLVQAHFSYTPKRVLPLSIGSHQVLAGNQEQWQQLRLLWRPLGCPWLTTRREVSQIWHFCLIASSSREQYPLHLTVFAYLILQGYLLYFMYVSILFTFMCVYCVHAWYQKQPEEGVGSLRAAVVDDCEPPSGWWEWKLDPLEEQ